MNQNPPIILVALNKRHYTNGGIKENGTFSVNISSVDMVKITDYCGQFSVNKADKSQLFEIFYGTHSTAPIIRRCPINLECKLLQTLEFDMNDIFIGEIVEAYTEEQYLTYNIPTI